MVQITYFEAFCRKSRCPQLKKVRKTEGDALHRQCGTGPISILPGGWTGEDHFFSEQIIYTNSHNLSTKSKDLLWPYVYIYRVESTSASAGASPVAPLARAAARMCESLRCSQFLQAVLPAARQVAVLQPPASGTLSCSWPSAGLCTSRGLIPADGWRRERQMYSRRKKKKSMNSRHILYHDCTCLQKTLHVTLLQKLPLQGLLFLWFSYDQK